MFDFDKWQEILHTINRHKLRTLLTAFGVFWGIFMLVLLLGAGQGLENAVTEDFRDLATNSVFVWGRRTQLPYKGLHPGRAIQLTNEDVEAVLENIPEIQYIGADGYLGSSLVNYHKKNGMFMVQGRSPAAINIEPLQIDGRFLNYRDMKERRKVAVIGQQVQQVLFGQENPFGEYVGIQGTFFQVVGVFHVRNPDDDGGDLEQIYIPLTTLQHTFNQGNQIGSFGAVVRENADASVVETKVKECLKRRHSIAPEDTQAIGSWNSGTEFGQLHALFRGIRIFVWIVGAGTIVAGIVGVSNIMLIIVKERTREIGIRKALGATPFSIVSLILQESIFITAISGYMGLVASVGLIELSSYLMDKFQLQSDYFSNPDIDFSAAITATIILVLTGALAGYIPARNAAKIHPIEALRSPP